MNRHESRLRCASALLICAILAAGCEIEQGTGPAPQSGPTPPGGTAALSGRILIDGSSTVYPVSQAVAEEFMKLHPKVQVTVGTSGTGGGFKKFTVGEMDISDASRPIADTEIAACRENNIEYVELKVAIDGLSVVVNPENDWCDCLNVEQLRELWKPGSSVNTWRDLNPDWPADEIKLFGPDTDSGTFDYFTEVIVGKTGESRADYEPSVNDNVLVRGVAGERNALGYFGYAYYVENQDTLKVLGIAQTADSACVKPEPATIEAGEYVPLARPLFLYVNRKALARPEVAEFLRYYLEEGQELVTERGYIKLSAPVLEEVQQTFRRAVDEGSPSETVPARSGG